MSDTVATGSLTMPKGVALLSKWKFRFPKGVGELQACPGLPAASVRHKSAPVVKPRLQKLNGVGQPMSVGGLNWQVLVQLSGKPGQSVPQFVLLQHELVPSQLPQLESLPQPSQLLA